MEAGNDKPLSPQEKLAQAKMGNLALSMDEIRALKKEIQASQASATVTPAPIVMPTAPEPLVTTTTSAPRPTSSPLPPDKLTSAPAPEERKVEARKVLKFLRDYQEKVKEGLQSPHINPAILGQEYGLSTNVAEQLFDKLQGLGVIDKTDSNRINLSALQDVDSTIQTSPEGPWQSWSFQESDSTTASPDTSATPAAAPKENITPRKLLTYLKGHIGTPITTALLMQQFNITAENADEVMGDIRRDGMVGKDDTPNLAEVQKTEQDLDAILDMDYIFGTSPTSAPTPISTPAPAPIDLDIDLNNPDVGIPSATPAPTSAPAPSATPAPTATPAPASSHTPTPAPSPTPSPTAAPSSAPTPDKQPNFTNKELLDFLKLWSGKVITALEISQHFNITINLADEILEKHLKAKDVVSGSGVVCDTDTIDYIEQNASTELNLLYKLPPSATPGPTPAPTPSAAPTSAPTPSPAPTPAPSAAPAPSSAPASPAGGPMAGLAAATNAASIQSSWYSRLTKKQIITGILVAGGLGLLGTSYKLMNAGEERGRTPEGAAAKADPKETKTPEAAKPKIENTQSASPTIKDPDFRKKGWWNSIEPEVQQNIDSLLKTKQSQEWIIKFYNKVEDMNRVEVQLTAEERLAIVNRLTAPNLVREAYNPDYRYNTVTDDCKISMNGTTCNIRENIASMVTEMKRIFEATDPANSQRLTAEMLEGKTPAQIYEWSKAKVTTIINQNN